MSGLLDFLVWFAVVFSILLVIVFAVSAIASAFIFTGAMAQIDDPFEVEITSERKN